MHCVITPVGSKNGLATPVLHHFTADPTLTWNVKGGCASATLPIRTKKQLQREWYQFANVKVYGQHGLYWEGIIWNIPRDLGSNANLTALGLSVALTFTPSDGLVYVRPFANSFFDRPYTDSHKSSNGSMEFNTSVFHRYNWGVTHKAGDWMMSVVPVGSATEIQIDGVYFRPHTNLKLEWYAGQYDETVNNGENIRWSPTPFFTFSGAGSSGGFFDRLPIGWEAGLPYYNGLPLIHFIGFRTVWTADTVLGTGEGSCSAYWQPTIWGAGFFWDFFNSGTEDLTFYPTIYNIVRHVLTTFFPSWATQLPYNLADYLSKDGAWAEFGEFVVNQGESWKDVIDRAVSYSDSCWGFYPTRVSGRETTAPFLWQMPSVNDQYATYIVDTQHAQVDLDDFDGDEMTDEVRVYYDPNTELGGFKPYLTSTSPAEENPHNSILISAGIKKRKTFDVDTQNKNVVMNVLDNYLLPENTRAVWKGKVTVHCLRNSYGALVSMGHVRCGETLEIQGFNGGHVRVRIIEATLTGEHTLELTVDSSSARDLSYSLAMAKKNVYWGNAQQYGSPLL